MSKLNLGLVGIALFCIVTTSLSNVLERTSHQTAITSSIAKGT